jgi:hypothetical protein
MIGALADALLAGLVAVVERVVGHGNLLGAVAHRPGEAELTNQNAGRFTHAQAAASDDNVASKAGEQVPCSGGAA